MIHAARAISEARSGQRPSLDTLWDSVPAGDRAFRLEDTASLPEAARRYLEHAIAPGTILASAVRMRMHGTFRLKGWCPFTAEQANRGDGELLWKASVFLHGLPIKGYDSVLSGGGKMQWKLFGLIPIAGGEGGDITRSGIGRLQCEAVWLPALLCGSEVAWTSPDAAHACARFTTLNEATELTLTIADDGRLKQVRCRRWGNPEGGAFRYSDFGGLVEEESTFAGFTIPTRLRVGWYVGSDKFDAGGEFFRVTIDEALFR